MRCSTHHHLVVVVCPGNNGRSTIFALFLFNFFFFRSNFLMFVIYLAYYYFCWLPEGNDWKSKWESRAFIFSLGVRHFGSNRNCSNDHGWWWWLWMKKTHLKSHSKEDSSSKWISLFSFTVLLFYILRFFRLSNDFSIYSIFNSTLGLSCLSIYWFIFLLNVLFFYGFEVYSKTMILISYRFWLYLCCVVMDFCLIYGRKRRRRWRSGSG